MRIRHVRMGDVRVIRDMEKRIFGRHAFPLSALVWHALRRRREFLVADAEDGVVGYLIARPSAEEAKCWEIASVAVREDSRGKGIGSRLIEQFLDYACRRGARRVSLEVSVLNPQAQSLYRRLGFAARDIIPSYYGPGEDGIRMVRDIAHAEGGTRK